MKSFFKAAEPTTVFPTKLGFRGLEGDDRISLHGDGTWSGDGAKFLAALEQLKGSPDASGTTLMLWLVAAQIRRDIDDAER